MDEVPLNPGDDPGAFELGDLQIDPSVGSIKGPNGQVRLEPRVMAVLVALARRPGELVSRQELLTGIWPGGDVYDEALTQCVYQLRQHLTNASGAGDSRELIATVPKRGYVLKARVSPLKLPEESTPAGPSPGKRKQWLTGGFLVVVLAGLAAWAMVHWRTPPEPAVGTTSQTLAVLPFLPLVEAHSEPVLELGMADTLITRLSRIRQLVVRPISSVRRYATLERDSLEAGRELGADVVVDASIQRSAEALRVSVRLLRVADGAALWAETFDEPVANLFSVQDDMCERIMAALAPQLDASERRNLAAGGTVNPGAYERYLKGRYHLARLTPADLRASVEEFEAAVALDPGYAQAWLGLANVQFRIPIAGEVPPRDYYPKARLAARRALEIDPSLAEGYAFLGWIAHWFEWDWASSEAHFKRAIEMNPNDTESHLGYAHLLADTGRPELAVAEVQRARELSPFYLVAAALEGGFLVGAGQAEEAVRRLEKAVQLDPQFWFTHISLASAYMALGRGADALAEARLARQVSGGSTWATAIEITILMAQGKREDAEILLGGMLQRSESHYVPPYDLAVALKAVGRNDEALAALERAYEARDPKMAFLGTHLMWGPLRDRPEFRDLLNRMNFPGSME